MTTNKQKKLLSSLWFELQQSLDNLSWSSYGRRLIELTTAESKDHDRFRGDSIRRGMTLADEARYFALKRIAEFAIKHEPAPPIEDYFSYQKSCYGAWALVHGQATKATVAAFVAEHRTELEEVLTWDYIRLIEEPVAA